MDRGWRAGGIDVVACQEKEVVFFVVLVFKGGRLAR